MKTPLIIAVCLCVVGILIVTVGLCVTGFRPDALGMPTVSHTIPVLEPFTAISVDAKTADVFFVPSTDGESRVECVDNEKLTLTAAVENGVLVVRCVDERKWYEHIGIFAEEMSVTVYLPEESYSSLTVKTNTGDVSFPTDLLFEAAEIETHTGDVIGPTARIGRLTVKTHTGDVKLSADTELLSVETHTGDVTLIRLGAEKDVAITTDTGDVTLTEVACGALTVKTNTGDVALTETVVSGHLSVETDTGDVELEASDATTLRIETDTGDVEGTLLTPKRVRADSGTGEVRVSDSDEGGLCEIVTSTGDVEIWIK